MKVSLLLSCLLCMLLLSPGCRDATVKKKEMEIIVRGTLANLPDGKIYVMKIPGQRIDSGETKNGQFEVPVKFEDTGYHYLGLEHIDNRNVKRKFIFKTKILFSGKESFSESFMSDPLINIEGTLDTFISVDFKLPDNFLIVYPDTGIQGGYQTNAMHSTAFDFKQEVTDSSILELTNTIRKFPYSIYLFDEVLKTKSKYSMLQFKSLLSAFDRELDSTAQAKEARAYISHKTYGKADNIYYLDRDNKKELILNKDAKLNIIIFWASWCGPCRAEIPMLKKIYNEFKRDDINFLSISVDAKKEKWLEALDMEQMPWRQGRVSAAEDKELLKLFFDYNGYIPLIVVRNKEKIIHKVEGNMEENEAVLKRIITENYQQ